MEKIFELCFTLRPDCGGPSRESHFGIKAIGVIQDKGWVILEAKWREN